MSNSNSTIIIAFLLLLIAIVYLCPKLRPTVSEQLGLCTPAKLLPAVCGGCRGCGCGGRANAGQVRVSARPADPWRHQEHLLPECERGDCAQLWHALRQQHLRGGRDPVQSPVGSCLVDAVLQLHSLHRAHVSY